MRVHPPSTTLPASRSTSHTRSLRTSLRSAGLPGGPLGVAGRVGTAGIICRIPRTLGAVVAGVPARMVNGIAFRWLTVDTYVSGATLAGAHGGHITSRSAQN
jgi:hypothetical protein